MGVFGVLHEFVDEVRVVGVEVRQERAQSFFKSIPASDIDVGPSVGAQFVKT